jgi:hypothetical protein
MAVERAVLANALAALSEAPSLGPGLAAVAADNVMFAARAIKDEGGLCVLFLGGVSSKEKAHGYFRSFSGVIQFSPFFW